MSELSSYIQLRLSTLREGVVGASWLLADSTRAAMDGEQPRADALILWGPTWLCTARLRQSISSLRSSLAPNSRTQENLPKRGRSETNGTGNAMDMDLDPTPDAELSRTENASGLNVRLTHKYQPLLLVDVMPPSASASDSPSQDGAQLVVVERPFFALAKGLPPAYYRGSRYGM